jgi:acyl-CoA thioesterase FadM
MHLHYLHEVKDSDELTVETSILDADRKRFHAGSVFRCTRLPEPVAIADAMLLHVHQGEKVTTAPLPPDIEARLQALKLTPEALAAFGPLSRRIELRRR